MLGMCYQCKDVTGNALSSTHMLIIAVVGHIVHDEATMLCLCYHYCTKHHYGSKLSTY